jgi:ABC-type multidrug transport system fused ATPase/permease subunit
MSMQIGKKLALVQGGFAGATSALAQLAVLVVLWYGATLVTKGDLTTGLLSSFMLFTLQVGTAGRQERRGGVACVSKRKSSNDSPQFTRVRLYF